MTTTQTLTLSEGILRRAVLANENKRNPLIRVREADILSGMRKVFNFCPTSMYHIVEKLMGQSVE
jgi:hypothetical protein